MWWLVIPVAVYSLMMLNWWRFLVWRRRRAGAEDHKVPHITVVVAARNEVRTIVSLLQALADQDYPLPGYDVIVVNDRSTDSTPVVVSEFISSKGYGNFIRLINNVSSGKKSAIHKAVSIASGDLVLTTDADCRPGRHWISAFAECYMATGADLMLGEVYEKAAAGFVSRFSMFEFSALQSVTEATALAGCPVMSNGASMGFRKEVWLGLSGEIRAEIESGDDLFMLHAVKAAGGRVVHAGREAAAETAGAGSAAALLRQRSRWASKTFRYRDAATLMLAAATAASNAAAAAAMTIALFSNDYIMTAVTIFAIRLAPDYLLVRYNIKKRDEHMPLLSFLISEVIYPFWFITVGLVSLFPSSARFRPR